MPHKCTILTSTRLALYILQFQLDLCIICNNRQRIFSTWEGVVLHMSMYKVYHIVYHVLVLLIFSSLSLLSRRSIFLRYSSHEYFPYALPRELISHDFLTY